ncbi:hypothetical protein [Streptomyces sp. DSM 40750]|uniref:hypothetical protein n=1 Tax=Streptomyces sp. DSM 40750 TaxID=2801030 RepID=UPI00214C3DDD|nr:hypothetical protein [Streptomyces sp. DSM 40750]UUU21684.1 hypothetical protein JIX55_15880 [Streptomyces sp. DSM 40750]
MSARDPEPCDGLTGDHTGPVRFYRTGWKCNTHSPWAEAGLDEPQPGYGHPSALPLSPLAASSVFDEKAIASGRRRSSPHTYRAAQAAVNHRKEPST